MAMINGMLLFKIFRKLRRNIMHSIHGWLGVKYGSWLVAEGSDPLIVNYRLISRPENS
jgi:hypothetical protein